VISSLLIVQRPMDIGSISRQSLSQPQRKGNPTNTVFSARVSYYIPAGEKAFLLTSVSASPAPLGRAGVRVFLASHASLEWESPSPGLSKGTS
jgi:hypothetical protein